MHRTMMCPRAWLAAALALCIAACANDRSATPDAARTGSAAAPLRDSTHPSPPAAPRTDPGADSDGNASSDDDASSDSAALLDALRRLVRGDSPAPREWSWFSPATRDVVRSAHVDSAGYAVVDFGNIAELVPNASTSAGSAILLEELNATVFAVAAVDSVQYRMNGSCAAFWEWLQYGCEVVHRTDVAPARRIP